MTNDAILDGCRSQQSMAMCDVRGAEEKRCRDCRKEGHTPWLGQAVSRRYHHCHQPDKGRECRSANQEEKGLRMVVVLWMKLEDVEEEEISLMGFV